MFNMANEKFTQLPTVTNAALTDIIAAVQSGVSVQETLQQVFTLMLSNTILHNAGNPNGSVAGVVYQFCWDTSGHILYVCTTSGNAATAVWTAAGSLTIPVPIASGGTGVTSVTTAPAASAWAGWDANKNLSANNFLSGYATTATAAATTTLLVGSAYQQFFTGSTTQTLVLPVTSTLALGQSFYVVNNSSGVVTVQSSGGNTILAMPADTAAFFNCILTSGTTAASWDYQTFSQSTITLPLSMLNGGTGASLTAANGAIPYSGASAMALLAPGLSGQLFQSGGAGAPNWTTSTYPLTNAINTLLYASSANVMAALATANSGILATTSTGVPIMLGPMTNGQLVIGSTTATPVVATVGSSGNISLSVGAGSLSIGTSGFASFAWNDVSGTSGSAAGNQGYIISNSSQTTMTIAASVTEGSVIRIAGKGASGWVLQANTGQTIHFGSSATTSAGSLTSTNQWDCVEIVCVTANTTFTVLSSVGNLTVA